MAPLSREEFNTRIDDIKEWFGQRFDSIEERLEKLEGMERPSSASSKFWGTAIGAALYAVVDYTWRKWSGQ